MINIFFRLGDEIAIPLSISDNDNLEPVNQVVSKTRSLIDLNVKLFNKLKSFTEEMENVDNISEEVL